MTEVVPASLTDHPWEEVARAAQAAANAPDAEAAIREIVHAALRITGDATAHERPGALKPGERHFRVGGVFMVSPDATSHLLLAEWGFPAEQHRLFYPLNTGHPGWVWKNEKPLILENTDDHGDFKHILKTARMGSAIYAPMIWEGVFIGHLITAAQARNTFTPPDLVRLQALAALATAAYMAKDGPNFLAQIWQDDCGGGGGELTNST
ncbi:MAG: GAF domain-containing protein [Rhodospirillaceae bacterium]|nr:GAF domain-containing protein [Rhodospirillaceae bacterium]